TNIETQLDNLRDVMRTDSLKWLHVNAVQQFIDSPGFGVARRIRPSPRYLEFREGEPFPFPVPAYEDQSRPVGTEDRITGQMRPADERILEMHDGNLVDFFDPRGFGYVKDRTQVVGFQPHHFRGNPMFRAPERWVVQELELVSLLKHEQPAVY